MTAFDLTPPTDAQRTALIAGLSEDERRVLLQHGTEAPFCGVFLDNKQDGVYTCRLCGLPLRNVRARAFFHQRHNIEEQDDARRHDEANAPVKKGNGE